MFIDTVIVRVLFRHPFLGDFISDQISGPLALTVFPLAPPYCSMSPRYRSYVVDVSVGAGLPQSVNPLHCIQWCFSVTISICCKQKLL